MAGVNYEPNYSYFIDLRLGSMNLGNKILSSGFHDPKYIQSLKLVKLGNGSVNNDGTVNKSDGNLYESAVFTLNAVNDLMLEKKILDYMKNSPKESKVKFQYGYVNGPKSPVYKGIITGMGMSEDFYSIILTVSWSGVADKYNEFTQETINEICSKQYTRYSDLVRDIANSQGWNIGKIVDTNEISPDSIEYPTINSRPINYVATKIAPNAVSANGEGKYQSLFKSLDGDEYYMFVPTKFLQSYKIVKNYNFIVRMLPNGQVISFRPTLVDGTAAAENMVSSPYNSNKNIYGTVTRDTKELVSIGYNISDDNSKSGLLDPSDQVIYASKGAIAQNSAYADALSYAESTIKDDFSAYCYSIAINPKASMQILGDPELNQLDLVNVLPMYPAESASSGGIMHPSGGTYMIIKITENIGTSYTTDLEMVKVKTMKLSDLMYHQPIPEPEPVPEVIPPSFKVGDRVWFLGATHYVSSYPGSKGYNNVVNMPGWATITIINQKLLNTPGAHPYHLIYENWAETHVYGWVDYGTFEKR